MAAMNFKNFDDDDIIIVGTSIVINHILETKAKKKRAKISPYFLDRPKKGRFVKDFDDLRKSGRLFVENFRLDPSTFDLLFNLVEPYLRPKRRTRPNIGITPREKLAVALEYLASGTLQRHIASIYRISKQHFGRILSDVCNAIINGLSTQICPLDEQILLSTSNDFFYKWHFPNTVGAIDGKHVSIKCPPNSGSLFYNYKGFHSVILMAVADAGYRFLYIDVGAYGSEGDAGVFSKCSLSRNISENKFCFPKDAAVGHEKLPFYLIGDDAFALTKHIMKPFVPSKKTKSLTDEERIYNYRLSRARRCVENAFGILCARWFCLARTMFCGPDRAQKIITACCYLHNFLIRHNTDSYCPPHFADSYDENGNLIEGEWRKKISNNSLFNSSNEKPSKGRHSNKAVEIREKLKKYVNSPEGSIPWQRKACHLE